MIMVQYLAIGCKPSLIIHCIPAGAGKRGVEWWVGCWGRMCGSGCMGGTTYRVRCGKWDLQWNQFTNARMHFTASDTLIIVYDRLAVAITK
jgi:hypothetical protein